jgi:hypothetical protein
MKPLIAPVFIPPRSEAEWDPTERARLCSTLIKSLSSTSVSLGSCLVAYFVIKKTGEIGELTEVWCSDNGSLSAI